MKKQILIIAAVTIQSLICNLQSARAQDVSFTQQFANPLRLNPAMMGGNNDLRAILNYRSQWGAVNNGYTSTSFTFLYPIFLKPDLWTKDEGSKSKLDIGLNVFHDKIGLYDKVGAFNTLDIQLSVGYGLRISKSHFLALSLSGGFVQKYLDVNQTFDEQYVNGSYNASNPSGETVLNQQAMYGDVGFGAMWSYFPEKGKFNVYAGMSGFHLNQPNETFVNRNSTLPIRFSFQAGVKFIGDGIVDFTPNLIVNTQNGVTQLIAGLLTDFRIGKSSKFVLGMWYRQKDAIAFQVGFEHKSFIFGYSYDFSHADITSAISRLSTHEFVLAYKLNMTTKKGLITNPYIF